MRDFEYYRYAGIRSKHIFPSRRYIDLINSVKAKGSLNGGGSSRSNFAQLRDMNFSRHSQVQIYKCAYL